jgi:hypothetical protein
MNDIEQLVDTWVYRVVAYHAGSDTSLKKACIVAAQVVGSYSGATGIIARDTRRSVASVENWAHAFRLYKELRKTDKLARVLWRELPCSHWWLAYDIQQSGYDALYYLTMAMQNAMSGRDMLNEWKRDREAGSAPIVFKRACISFFGLASELEKHKRQLSVKQVETLAMVKKYFA